MLQFINWSDDLIQQNKLSELYLKKLIQYNKKAKERIASISEDKPQSDDQQAKDLNTNEEEEEDNSCSESYYPNKLMLCTVMGLVALFTSVFGLIPSIISMNMANELPLEFSPLDVKRARNISNAAVIINTIEVIVGIIIGLIILLQNI